ncbi:hypothetical protein BaRGS_00015533, partial [Batillaria attramentaria]
AVADLSSLVPKDRNRSCDQGGVIKLTPEEQAQRILEKYDECNNTYSFYQTTTPASNVGSQCPAVWDGVMCWPPTEAGVTVIRPCPDYVDGFLSHREYTGYPIITENASRTCTEDGEWFFNTEMNHTWTDFRNCLGKGTESAFPPLIRKHLGRIKLMYNIGYGISLASLVLAVAIMLCFKSHVTFKKLHCPRNTIHLNLFASFILRATMSFMKENLLVEGLGFHSDVIETDDGIQFKENSP